MACADKNERRREGTGRYDRQLKALSPDFAKVDERGLPHLLAFLQRYADHIAYIDAENKVNGTWKALIQRDVSMALATLAVLQPVRLADYHKALVKGVRLAIRDNDTAAAKQRFKFIIDFVYTLATLIDDQCAGLADNPVYQQELRDILTRKMGKPVCQVLELAKAHPALWPPTPHIDTEAPIAIQNAAIPAYAFRYIELTSGPLNISVPDADELTKINFIVHHNLFQQHVKAVLAGATLAVRNAETSLTKSLTHHDNHRPHITLLLAFLRLFGHAQQQLNDFGKRHLEYYYRDVLQLKMRDPEPDRAHLVFGLHRHVADHLLAAGTLFKGGKDKDGKVLTYRLAQDVVLNQANVSRLDTLRKSSGKVVYGAGTADGSLAQVGFAVASSLLHMTGGERTVSVSIRFKQASGLGLRSRVQRLAFRTRLTGEKGWLDDRVQATYQPQRGELSFSITLDGGADAIVPYNEQIHQQQMDVSLPMLLVYLDQQAMGAAYDQFARPVIDRVQLSVDVRGYKDAVLSNDIGLLDASKPFKPFGDLPRRNAGCYIGSDELFRKPLTSLSLVTDLPNEFTASYLHRGAWNPLTKTPVAGGYALGMPGIAMAGTTVPMGVKRGFGAGEREGYIRLSLTSDGYSLASFMDRLTQSFNETKLMKIPMAASVAVERLFADPATMATATAKKATETVMVSAESVHKDVLKAVTAATQFEGYRLVRNSTPTPRELVVDAFEINYTATETIAFAQRATKQGFLHLYPSGYRWIANNEQAGVFPAFPNEGEWFVGLAQARPPQTISLLVDVVEGSANPLKAGEPVRWFYLDGTNDWKPFDRSALVDGTKNLTRTGIVQLSLPAGATQAGTTMPSGMHWIKMAVASNIDAVCKPVSITAQAATVALVQEIPSGSYFKATLPKGTITKALASDAAIKRIEQPDDSFGGRPTEQPSAFYTRVSERLRHKQRAITIWDYEHLVLEHFPAIYKVKCINRAGFVDHDGKTEFCENYPGHVTVIAIPDLRQATRANALRPYTPIGLLVDIAGYLDGLRNPFVTLHVRNPQFEEIQLEFDVIFQANLDEAFHLNLLNDDIERFLCPWAFDTSRSVAFGGRMQQATLVNFIDERPYVHVVSAFKMHHIIRNEAGGVQSIEQDVQEAVASSPRSVLVSYADGTTRHLIRVIQNCECK